MKTEEVNFEQVFSSMISILKHIQEVDSNISALIQKSTQTFVDELMKHSIDHTLNQEIIEAVQVQDIISQQFSAVSDALEAMQNNLDIYLHAMRTDQAILDQSLKKLHTKMVVSLKEAKDKYSAFAGNTLTSNQPNPTTIDFF